MLLRLRIDEVHGKHVRTSVFEGREHGPFLGQIVFDREKFEGSFREHEIVAGATYEADLDLDLRVR